MRRLAVLRLWFPLAFATGGDYLGSSGHDIGDLVTHARPGALALPANPTLLKRSMLETAGTVAATLAALEDGMAANLAGGITTPPA